MFGGTAAGDSFQCEPKSVAVGRFARMIRAHSSADRNESAVIPADVADIGLPHAQAWGILKPTARARDTDRAGGSIVDGTDDERVRRLQRIAYGAHASAEERGAALDELGRLERAEMESAGEAPAAAARDVSRDASAVVAPDVIVDDPATAPRRRSRGFALRAGVIAGAGALVIGVVAGFALGWQSRPNDPADAGSADTPGPIELGPRLHADVFASMPIALETDAAQVFDRTPIAADTPDLVTPLVEVTSLEGPVDTRLLATSPDGVTLFAARDDTDLCLIAEFGDGGAASVCTQRGRFPTEGLRMTAGGLDVVDIAWTEDGVLHFTTSD